MRGKLMRGITTGAMIGILVGMAVTSNMNRSSRKRIRKSGKFMRNAMEDLYDNIIS